MKKKIRLRVVVNHDGARANTERQSQWRQIKVSELLIRPGTRAPFWEARIRNEKGQRKNALVTIVDTFTGEHIVRRKVPSDAYPF